MGAWNTLRPTLSVFMTVWLTGCLSANPPLPVVASVDLTRYAGVWYEIARFPAPFQRDCTGTTAEYTLQDDGTVRVVNRCRSGSLDGPERTIEGTARVLDPLEPAKLGVRFFGPFEAPYWIILLDDEYQWAVVSEPTRTFLWILSRTPAIDDALLNELYVELVDLGFDPGRLESTPQRPSAE